MYWALQVQEGSIEMSCIVSVVVSIVVLDKTISYTLTNCVVYFLIKLAITIDQNKIKT